ncbi:hypothetical protein MRB53_010549 [Persea americana]|uniref:Uncharacterized protein n=1 Tax=Persea americana TaxID=3435 RepID=A0ACC2LS74_PERAE|nr:hypothetical protein MRB53_010549 [Persea americana]
MHATSVSLPQPHMGSTPSFLVDIGQVADHSHSVDPSCVATCTSSTKLPLAQTHGNNFIVAKLPPQTCAPSSVIPVETFMGPIANMSHGDAKLMQPNSSLITRTNDDPTIHIPDSTPQRPHTMHTRAMDGIFKPKTLLATKHSLPHAFHTTIVPNEPTSYSQAVKHANWQATMATEFDAL